MLYIIRHGQTELNSRHVLQGRSDQPLNGEGIRQGQEAARRLAGIPFLRVYSSPLRRALETARLVAPGLTPIVDERLIEMDYGPYEGMDLRNPAPEILPFFRDFAHTPAPAGVEQLGDVVARAGRFLLDADKTGDVLISTHAIAMKGLLEYLTPDSHGAYWSKNIPNCGIYVADYAEGRFTVPRELT